MKPSTFIVGLTLFFASASSSQACCLLPWLNPLAWMGAHGCGGVHGYGCCAQQAPAYRPYVPRPVYQYRAPAAPACQCTTAPAPAMTAVQVPITTYRPVTQYVPQTTYRTEYRYSSQPGVAYGTPPYAAPQPAVAYGPPQYGRPAYQPAPPAISYGAPVYSRPTYGVPSNQQAPVIYGNPAVATPLPVPAGDIGGDHEYPTQSSLAPIVPNSYSGGTPVRAASYGVTPSPARRYSGIVR